MIGDRDHPNRLGSLVFRCPYCIGQRSGETAGRPDAAARAARVYLEAAGRTGSAKTIWKRTAIFMLTVRLERRSRIPREGDPRSGLVRGRRGGLSAISWIHPHQGCSRARSSNPERRSPGSGGAESTSQASRARRATGRAPQQRIAKSRHSNAHWESQPLPPVARVDRVREQRGDTARPALDDSPQGSNTGSSREREVCAPPLRSD
jgi:hypothetical protein